MARVQLENDPDVSRVNITAFRSFFHHKLHGYYTNFEDVLKHHLSPRDRYILMVYLSLRSLSTAVSTNNIALLIQEDEVQITRALESLIEQDYLEVASLNSYRMTTKLETLLNTYRPVGWALRLYEAAQRDMKRGFEVSEITIRFAQDVAENERQHSFRNMDELNNEIIDPRDGGNPF
jgi:hypothetical protein